MNKPCLDCNAIGAWGRDGRCTTHRRARIRLYESNPLRKAYKADRYNNEYRKERAVWVSLVATGNVNCSRCGEPIQGASWDLDHIHDTLLPAHPSCNRGKR